jgi:phenylacetate-coenzyme A ligase PaaK-like adenylate-forming protein
MMKKMMYDSFRAYRRVMADYNLDRERLRSVISDRLYHVLLAAYRSVPYYRDLFDSIGYNPETDYTGTDDISSMPVLTKETIKRHGEESFVREGEDTSKYFMDATSGSTGIPLRVWRDQWARALQIAKWLRVLRVNGFRFTDRVMSLTSPARLDEGKTFLAHFGLLRRRAIDYLLPPEKMVDELIAYKPDILYGNRSHLDNICHEFNRRSMKYGGLKVILSGAEIIRESSRKLYKDVFDCTIAEFFGSVEMGIMAFETPSINGLELCEDLTYFEFLDAEGNTAGPGESGRLVVTDLTNTLMPIIRYDHLDRVVLSPNRTTDGRERRIIEHIEGRDDDFAVMPDGTRIPFHVFYEIMDKYGGIRQFRIIQKAIDLYHVLVSADEEYMSNVHGDILSDYRRHFPENVKFEIIVSDRIDPDPNGKLRMLISEVQ